MKLQNIMILQNILQDALSYHASDIHIQQQIGTSDITMYFRVRKQMLPYLYYSAEEEREEKARFIQEALATLMGETPNEQSVSAQVGGIGIRISSFLADHSNTLHYAIRLLNAQIPTLQDIQAPKVLADLCLKESGLILVCGATGAGKSTTLAAMIRHINTHAKKHILTIEDPIEYRHTSRESLVSQREIGRDSRDFHAALTASLRHDPDVIMIGEILDSEVLRAALEHALSGHLVLASFHASNCMDAISRMIGMRQHDGNIRTNLATCLQGIITQRLCDNGESLVADFEVLVANAAVCALIKEDKIWQLDSQISMGKPFGMQHFTHT